MVHHDRTGRREFLTQVSAAAAAGAVGLRGATAAESTRTAPPATTPVPLPSIQLGPHRISRLVCGWNPIGGYSHATRDLSNGMKEWFTVDRTAALLEDCMRNGINAWQFDHEPHAVQTLRKLWDKGIEPKAFCLHAEREHDAPLRTVVRETKAFAIAHHGGVTDAKFREGKSQEVRDFVKKVKDLGLLAAVSAHKPDNIKRIADEGWENDFFMCCFFCLSRPREEMQKQFGMVPVDEPMFESDRTEMTAVIRQMAKPCLGFKILAAGRYCWSQKQVAESFQYAFANIKPIDGVIVGMYPRYFNQVRDNAGHTRQYGSVPGTAHGPRAG
ncbi:MAG: hypothetical protein ABSG68_12505 [Thermoguttaceae bacterium]|jgi:hypothetical protein